MKKIFGFWIFLTIIIGIESVKQLNRFIRGTVSQSNSRAVHNRTTAEQIQQRHRATGQQQNTISASME